VFQVFLVAVVIVVSSTFTVFALTRPWVGHVLVSHGAYQTAIAVDSTGAFHIVIADSSLLYSTTAGGGWTTTVLDGNHSVFRAVLARDTKDHLHVVEEAYPHRTGPPGDVAMASIRYWTNSPGGWSATTIDTVGRGASIAIDRSDHIHVVYLKTNGSALELRHASDAAGSWASTPVLRWLEWAPSDAGGASAVAVSPSGTVHITLSGGYSLHYVTNESGCKKGGVMNWRGGVTTRAVLYDIAQLKGVDWVDPNTPVTRADLEAWEQKSGVKIGPGDIPLLYTGRWKRRAALGPWTGQVAGYYPDTIPWMHERLPAFIGHDFNIDWNPRPGWEGMRNPIHVAVLIWMGINIVECLDLEELAATARRLNRYEFVITFAPLPVEGGTGSPVNPLATF